MAKHSRKRFATRLHEDPIAQIFDAWQLWLLGALVGALLGWAIFAIFPPAFRARAIVVVDNNLEEAWVYFPDRQLFQFLARETERLEQLAWSDLVMQPVSAEAGIPVQDLRGGILQLSQPSDGGWYFYATNSDPAVAQKLAAAWVQTFVEAAHHAVAAAPELQAARAALEAEALLSAPDEARLQELMAQVSQLAEQTKGISIFTDLSISQAAELPVERAVTRSTYLFVGSLVGALAAPLWVLLAPATLPTALRHWALRRN
jgi:hypothetical protein